MNLLAPTLSLIIIVVTACSAKESETEPCVQRTSDGPWAEIGQKAPLERDIAQEFSTGGGEALFKLLGAPFLRTTEEAVWIFESRREAVHMWCDPSEELVKYDQFFTIIRLQIQQGKEICEIEGKEFISDRLISTDVAMQKPRSPLGFKPRLCDSEK